MIFTDEQQLKDRVESLTGRKIYGRAQVVEDTTDYMRIYGGMVLRLGGNDYFITGDAVEGRFGIADQPKTWVKYAYDLTDGSRKIIKMVFYEDMTSRAGAFLMRLTRSPEKEARCLEAVKGHPRFMQGFSLRDPAGNLVRIIDMIQGKSLFVKLQDGDIGHEEYFHTQFPKVMEEVLGCIEALQFLEQKGEHHGDVRNDHIFIDNDTGTYRWIDFDYSVSYQDYDILSLGNILAFVTARKIVRFSEVKDKPALYPLCDCSALTPEDGLLLFNYRVANLKKLYPYIPEKWNRVLMNFSAGTYFFYEEYQDLINDIRAALADLPH